MGPTNLRCVAQDKWSDYLKLVDSDILKRDHQIDFMNDYFPPQNFDLGNFITKLYTA